MISEEGVNPFEKAAAYKNGLKFEPSKGEACSTLLNLLKKKSYPPTEARIEPDFGSIEINALCASGIWVREIVLVMLSLDSQTKSPSFIISKKDLGLAPLLFSEM